jgi:hypothetical protein
MLFRLAVRNIADNLLDRLVRTADFFQKLATHAVGLGLSRDYQAIRIREKRAGTQLMIDFCCLGVINQSLRVAP